MQVAERLIKAGAKLETRDIRGLTPLHVAVLSDQVVIVRALVRAGLFLLVTRPLSLLFTLVQICASTLSQTHARERTLHTHAHTPHTCTLHTYVPHTCTRSLTQDTHTHTYNTHTHTHTHTLTHTGARIHAKQPLLNLGRIGSNARQDDAGEQDNGHGAQGASHGRARTPLEWAKVSGSRLLVSALLGCCPQRTGLELSEAVMGDTEETTHESEAFDASWRNGGWRKKDREGGRSRLAASVEERVVEYAHAAIADNIKVCSLAPSHPAKLTSRVCS